jgi:hypothetical protein
VTSLILTGILEDLIVFGLVSLVCIAVPVTVYIVALCLRGKR